jgi:hypothetical protein
MSRLFAGNYRDLQKSSHGSHCEPIYVFVIASDLPAKAWQAGAWQSHEIASADEISLAMTGKGDASK